MYEPKFILGTGSNKDLRNSFIDTRLNINGCMPYNVVNNDLYWNVERNELEYTRDIDDDFYVNAFFNMPQTYDFDISKVVENVYTVNYCYHKFNPDNSMDFGSISDEIGTERFNRTKVHSILKSYAEKYNVTVSALDMNLGYYDVVDVYDKHKSDFDHIRLYPADVMYVDPTLFEDIRCKLNYPGYDIFSNVFYKFSAIYGFDRDTKSFFIKSDFLDKKTHSCINILQEDAWIYYIWMGDAEKQKDLSSDAVLWRCYFKNNDFVKYHMLAKGAVLDKISKFVKISSAFGMKESDGELIISAETRSDIFKVLTFMKNNNLLKIENGVYDDAQSINEVGSGYKLSDFMNLYTGEFLSQ